MVIDISSRITNDYRCEIIDYRIDKVKDLNTEEEIDQAIYE